MKTLTLKRQLTTQQGEALKSKFLDESNFDELVTEDCDAYEPNGELLFRFRKNIIPFDILKEGYEGFKGAIQKTDSRGVASGGTKKRFRKDGTLSNVNSGIPVQSGLVGYMDPAGLNRFCRKTAFTRQFFDTFERGLPFVEFVDKMYKELCPKHYRKQISIAKGTDINYRIGQTSFTTVTVNRNFQTAVHKDAGDFPQGFGNLAVYREGSYEGAYFCLPEYRTAIDMQNCDLLFVDVHKWHGNTPFVNPSADYLRIAFVMYYREYMYKCDKPSKELARIKTDQTGFYKL